MLHQLEITTRCNFSCFYCAGRDMPQRDMAWERFVGIVDAIAKPRVTVSLQGEGEPSLHPRFWDMVAHVKLRGHVPYTILNGSRVDADRIAANLPTVAVSVDTLDPAEAERIGRHNLQKVMDNVEALVTAMGAGRIVIMSVDVGQPMDLLREWVRLNRFQHHVVQPLQPKADYAKRYRVAPPKPLPRLPMTCRFVERDLMRFHPLEGPALPCAFIKDTTGIVSIAGLRQAIGTGEPPAGCLGCRELRPKAPAAALR